MALIRCPNCNGEISDTAPTCSHCGHVVRPKKERMTRLLLSAYNIGCLAILAMLATAFVVWVLRTFG
jgi:predicted nucleic acid-binding Zn ribbon protein